MNHNRVFLVLTIGLLLTRVGLAHAAQLQVDSNAPYLCAAVEGGDTTNGTPVLAYSCSGSFGQQWNLVNGQLQGIGTANGKTMCLDVEGSGTSAGTKVDLFECNGGLNQQWAIIEADVGPNKGSTEIHAYGVQEFELCLDSSGGPSVGGGTQLVINPCNFASSSQKWIVRRMELELNTSAPHLCAAVQGSKTASGTPVIAYSCSGGFNDEWNFNGGRILGIGSANGTSTCLTAANTIGSLVTLNTCNGSIDQFWWVSPLLTSSSSAYFGAIFKAHGGLCLNSSGGPSVGGGTQLIVDVCSNAASQNWNLH
jgi:Ricin-type beta-trefoil lectin domain